MDIIHCHDWSSASVTWLFKDHYMQYGLSNTKIVFTTLNLKLPTFGRLWHIRTSVPPFPQRIRGKLLGILPWLLISTNCMVSSMALTPINGTLTTISSFLVHYTWENVVEGKRAAKAWFKESLSSISRNHISLGSSERTPSYQFLVLIFACALCDIVCMHGNVPFYWFGCMKPIYMLHTLRPRG